MATQAISQNSSVTGTSSLQDWRIPKQMSTTWMGKAIEFIREERPPLQKIGVYVLTFFAAAILCLSLIGIPLVLSAVSEYNRQEEEEFQTTGLMRQKLEEGLSRRNITIEAALAQAIGDANAVQNLPILDLRGREGMTGYIDFLKPEDLTHSVMKGVDQFQRPLYSFRVRNKFNGESMVVTLFQRYTNQPGHWTHGCNYARYKELFRENIVGAGEAVNLYNLFQQRSSFELV